MKKTEKAAEFKKVSLSQFVKDCGRSDAEAAFESVKMPRRATAGSAGYDFFAPFDITVKKGESVVVPTGLRCRIIDGYFLCILPRSGLGFKYALSLSNTAGVIDADYFGAENEGHILIKLSNFNCKEDVFIEKGKAFAQGIFIPFGITFDDDAKGKRKGGFGSSEINS